jgi:hypothetical protein
LSPVGDVASAVENALAAYSDTTVAPHEYFDQTGVADALTSGEPSFGGQRPAGFIGGCRSNVEGIGRDHLSASCSPKSF